MNYTKNVAVISGLITSLKVNHDPSTAQDIVDMSVKVTGPKGVQHTEYAKILCGRVLGPTEELNCAIEGRLIVLQGRIKKSETQKNLSYIEAIEWEIG